jgi:hypothetical protein
MDFGGYKLVIEDENGKREVILKTNVRAPVTGDWVQDAEGRWYAIRLAMHPKMSSARPDVRGLVLYGVPVESLESNPQAPNDDPPPGPEGSPSTPKGPRTKPSLRVLSFDPPRAADSQIFPPALVLTLVVAGYQEQSFQFESAKFDAWKLVHSDSHWFLEPLPRASAEELRRLSREAVCQLRTVENYVFGEWPVQAAASLPSSNVLDLASYRQIKSAGMPRGK